MLTIALVAMVLATGVEVGIIWRLERRIKKLRKQLAESEAIRMNVLEAHDHYEDRVAEERLEESLAAFAARVKR